MSASSAPGQAPSIPSDPPSTQSAPADDPAASLRAAALLTLKSKRRKLGAVSETATQMSRSVAAPPSIQLDYGQEELPVAGPSTASSAPVAPTPVPQDDGQAREEGEISDSETPSTPSFQPRIAPRPSDKSHDRYPSPLKSMAPPPPNPPPSAVKIEPPVTPVLLEPPIVPGSIAASWIIDADHVRPGLAMNQAQYDAAKDIILDLLGWGVPPEYLVSGGLSREIVYYVFVELNLRLPANLDITGLPTYPPPLPPPLPTSSRLSPPPNARPITSESPRAGTLSVAAPSFVPGSSSPSLHDMEAQRRQELLARKAVLASRKLKQQASTSSVEASAPAPTPVTTSVQVPEPQDVEMMAENDSHKRVDDFLKSIEPTNDQGMGAPALPSRTSTFDDMDIDEPIPGLTASEAIPPSASSTRSMSFSDAASLASAVPSSSASSDSNGSFRPSPHSVVTAVGGGVETDSAIPMTIVQPRAESAGLEQTFTSMRRGTKRPVAADFVDMEPGPSRTHSSNGHRQSGYYTKRKMGTFAGVSSMRRCVIDVSDSEEEEDGYIDEYPTDPTPAQPSRSNSFRTAPTSTSTAMPVPALLSPTISPANVLSPAALIEKEEEIRRMRELIQQREQNRRRKLAIIQTTPTPSFGSTPSTAGPASVKEEEDDSMAVRSLNGFGETQALSRSVHDPSLNGVSSYDAVPMSITLPESASVSTSSTGTPIDVISNTFEHSTTGDKVLTNEARQEQAVHDPRQSTPSYAQQLTLGQVGVISSHAETSAQAQADSSDLQTQVQGQVQGQDARFAAYSSPLDMYPLLRAHSRPLFSKPSSSSTAQLPSQSAHTSGLVAIDLTALKVASAKNMLTDSSRRICQYEVPGGGECRDRDCEDLHLSRVSAIEPSDELTAQYLCAMPLIGSRCNTQDLKDALEDTRRRHPTKTFDDRVSYTLLSLGVR